MKKEKRMMIGELGMHLGESVYVQGFVHRIRQLKKVTFVIVKDPTGMVQCVLDGAKELSFYPETAVCCKGVLKEGINSYGNYEILLSEVIPYGISEESLPIQVNQENLEVNLDTLLNYRVLSLRHPKEMAIFKIESELAFQFESFLREQNFIKIHTPKIVKEGAEGGSEVFSLDYFGKKAYLAQSPQFYKQMMVLSGMERVYEVGPVFRAESHNTSRHLNEYISLDMEMGFVEDEEELMDFETELLRQMLAKVSQNCKGEMELLQVKDCVIPNRIPRLKLKEAVEILKEKYGKDSEEIDLDPEGEKLIYEYIKETTGSEFVFLTHYPRKKRPMYTMPWEEAETRSFDLLFRGLEITTGGLRIHQLEMLKNSMLERGFNPEEYSSYLDAFRFGTIPHGGLAIGLERLVSKLLGFSNVRRACLFPRDTQRLIP